MHPDETQSDVAQLTRERDEALEREKATADVLRVIAGSPGDLSPVFSAILENATRICQAQFGNLLLIDNDEIRPVAMCRAGSRTGWRGEEPFLGIRRPGGSAGAH
jgi:hypothetical protein